MIHGVSRIAVTVGAVVLGAVIGVAAVAVHREWWGLLLAAVATGALLVAIPGGWWRRLPFAVGWVVVVGAATAERPEGDLLITNELPGWLLLGLGLVTLLGGIVGLRPRRAAAEDS